MDVFRILCPVSGGGCDVSDQMAFYERYLYISVHCVSGSGYRLAYSCGNYVAAEKYRDDVECDKTRKERLNLENIIVFAIFWAIVCALVSNLVVTTTKYMDKAQRENAQVAASELKMADNTVELGNYES